MAEHPNAVLLRQVADAFAAGDMDSLAGMMTEDVAWHTPGTNPISGDFVGRGRVLEHFGKLRELSGGTYKADPIDILADDARAVVVLHETGTRNGKTLDTREVLVSEIRGGKIAETQSFASDEGQENAFWS